VYADVPGGFVPTGGRGREITLEERWYADEEIQAGADLNAAMADGSGDCEQKDYTVMARLNAEKPTRY
jgi:hypothetical protein